MLTVKSRLQVSSKGANGREHYEGTWDTIGKILRVEGITAFYKGLQVKIFQSVLAAALLFITKEEIADALRRALTSQEKKEARLQV